MTLPRVQTLWIGPRLTVMERLALTSFVQQGHEVDLYTYGEVANVPDGVNVRDGAELLPEAAIFLYRDHRSYSGFSNFFRYKLLLERGGCWVDTDLVALRPVTLDGEHVFASENARGGRHVTTSFIAAPAGSPAMERAWELCAAKDRTSIRWGETGPALLQQVVETLDLHRHVQAPEVFCPIPFPEWESLLDPVPPALPGHAAAVHLWNELWRRAGRDKDAEFDPRCLYEQLKARYLTRTETTSGRGTVCGS